MAMGSTKALRSMVLAALAALLGAALAGPAAAVPIPVGEGDDTGCLDRSFVAGDLQAHNDATNGNFWVRRDTFTMDSGQECGTANINGISIIVKTPLQIDTDPEVDDIDTGNGSSLALRTELASLWPDFHPEFGTAFYDEASNGPPTGAFANTFQAARICLAVSGSISIASCLAGSPMVLTDIGGGFMIFTIDLGDDSFSLDEFEGDDDFELVTIVHSDVLGDFMGGNDLPELVLGWRFVELVPEPALAWLLAPALLLALRRRAS